MTFQPGGRNDALLFSIAALDIRNQMVPFGTPASAAYPLANLALFVPFSVPVPCVALEGYACAGTVAGGNFDIGIYDAGGTRLTHSGTTARTVSIPNMTSGMPDYTLTPGRIYYMAFSADGTNTWASVATSAGLCEAQGVLEAQTAFVLPASVSYVKTTRAYMLMFGLNLQATGF